MPTVIVAVTEKTRLTDNRWNTTVVKILKINGTDSNDILRKATALKAQILENYKDPKPEIIHKVLATFTEDF